MVESTYQYNSHHQGNGQVRDPAPACPPQGQDPEKREDQDGDFGCIGIKALWLADPCETYTGDEACTDEG
jgi:hypothetical protein